MLVPRGAVLSAATGSGLETGGLSLRFVRLVQANLGLTGNHFGEFSVCFLCASST